MRFLTYIIFLKLSCVVLKDENTIVERFLIKLKTKISINMQSNVVFKMNSKEYPTCYVGQTRGYLKNRLNGHERDAKKS